MKNRNILEKIFLFLFIVLLLSVLNSLAFLTSYSFFLEKTYRAISENKYEAVVIGYKKEIIRSKNFSSSSYSDEIVFFPKVKYINTEGKEVTKTLDLTSNKPLKLGEKIKITANTETGNANTLHLDWLMFLGGSIFTGIVAFFTFLISSYITNFSTKKRVVLSFYFGLLLISLNFLCIIIINFME